MTRRSKPPAGARRPRWLRCPVVRRTRAPLGFGAATLLAAATLATSGARAEAPGSGPAKGRPERRLAAPSGSRRADAVAPGEEEADSAVVAEAPESPAGAPGARHAVVRLEASGPPLPRYELWAGHQITVGRREAPFVGFVETRTEHFFLARVERRGNEIRVTPTTCRVEIAPTAGVAVRFPPGAPARMPKVTTVWKVAEDGTLSTRPWVMEWRDEDVDGDGEPGVTMLVDGPMCDGRVFMGAWNKTWAEGELFEGGIKGRIKVRSVETFLGADSFCLRIAGRNDSQTVTGTFTFLPVREGLTCADLLDAGWPVRADEPKR